MRPNFRFTVALVLILLPLLSIQSEPKIPNRILIFYKTAGYYHESIPTGIRTLVKLAKENKFQADSTNDASTFTASNLAKYKAVVFLNTTEDVLNDPQQVAFKNYIEGGGGFVGIHAAADTEYDWPWYNKLVGAYFNGHPNNPNVRFGMMEVRDRNHASTSHLPSNWGRRDEWYNYKNIQEDLHILINLDEKSYSGGTNGDDHPIAWYHSVGKGRAFYTGGGHSHESYGEYLFQMHLLGGIKYAMGVK